MLYPETEPDGALQLRSTAIGTPDPLRATTALLFVVELLAIVSLPVAAPVAVGSNCTLSVAVWLGLSVSGNVAPETLNPVPDTAAEFTVTAAVPFEESVTDCVAGVPKGTLPKATLVAFTDRLAPTAVPDELSVRAKVSLAPFAVAVMVAEAVELTAATVAVKPMLLALAGTSTDAGTFTAALLLLRSTRIPSLGAADASATVQASELFPVIDALLHDKLLSAGTDCAPDPINEIVRDGVATVLLETTTWPEALPSSVGLK